MKEFLFEQKLNIKKLFNELNSLDDKITQIRPEGKWSIKEIIGHLIDSASNNHQRFILSQFTEDLIFPGYNQDDWVKTQNYNSAEWSLLLNTWYNFNLILINSIENINEKQLKSERKNHNLNEIAWQVVDKSEPATLEYFIKDYFGHLNHHINQIHSTFKIIENN